jgi:ribosome-associated translation inhibitor RaiA
MSELDFHVDFFIETPELGDELIAEAEQRLYALAENHKDFIGAAISVEDIAGVEDRFLYQARIVAYMKPENIAVIEKRESAQTAFKDALTTIEDQIRSERNKRGKVWHQPDQRKHLSMQELSAREIFNTYVGEAISEEMLAKGRDTIAAELISAEKLDQESAYYAADRILEHAQQRTSGQ